MTEKLDGLSMDIEQSEREKLRCLFPQCFEEGKLNIDCLLNLCGEYIADDFEKYEFRWKGKSECVQIAGKRSAGTLLPCPEESVDWENTKNLYIEGDNLEVLKLLQTSYYRKVKMIYIDPPYNTGNDFVYVDDFADPLQRYREVTGQTTKSNPETMGRFHTNWLNMMWPRLRLAANLLRDDGVIFISIDDGEITNLRKICDEIFGEENFMGVFLWRRRQRADNRNQNNVSSDHEYVLSYAKTSLAKFIGQSIDTSKYKNPDNDPRGPWASVDLSGLATASQRPNLHYDIVDPNTGNTYPPNPNRGWSKSKENVLRMIEEKRILFPSDAKGRPREKKFLSNLLSQTTGFSTCLNSDSVGYTTNGTREVTELFGGKHFDFPKPTGLIKGFIRQVTHNNDIILDFFSGSATTAHAVMQLNAEDGGNRRFILVQLPEVTDEKSEAYKAGYKNICEIGKERIRRAGAKIVEQGVKKWEVKDYENTPEQTSFTYNLGDYENPDDNFDCGFRVFKLDSSNLKIWDDSPLGGEEAATLFEQRLMDYLDVLVPGRSPVDVVYEIMLKLGQDLCEPIVAIDLPGDRQVYGVSEDVKFIVCLAPGITPEDAATMAEYAPGRIVFAEQCFDTTEQKSNVRLTLKDLGISIKTL